MTELLKPRILRYEIMEQDAGKTIKEYLMRKIGFSSKQLSRFKYRKDGILLNGEKRYVNAVLQEGDVLEIRLTQGGEPAEEDPCRPLSCQGAYVAARDGRLQKIWVKPVEWLSSGYPLKILYEDQDILAADKPSGVVCHPSPGHFNDTLSNQVAEHLGRIGQELDVRVTGRLDKDTSGIVVFALNTETAAQLIKQRQAEMAYRFSFEEAAAKLPSAAENDGSLLFRDPESVLSFMTSGENYKLYIARVRGHFENQLTGTVDLPLRRESRNSFRMTAAEDGKEARTHYAVLKQLPDGTSLVACRIEHGRTHQIRVHMSLTGHPIVGDRMYGPEAEGGSAVQELIAGEDICPLMLHAYRVGFRQPFTGEPVRIEAALPEWAMDIKAQC